MRSLARSFSRWCSPSPFRRSRAVIASSHQSHRFTEEQPSPCILRAQCAGVLPGPDLATAIGSCPRAYRGAREARGAPHSAAAAPRLAPQVAPPPVDAAGACPRPLPRAGPAPLRVRLERYTAWVCIHRHEGAWNDSGDPYWGGLQMDRGFMRAYGRDMIARHHGGLADTWTPAEQIVVAERAYASRGFAPGRTPRGAAASSRRSRRPSVGDVGLSDDLRRPDAHEQLAGDAVARPVLVRASAPM